MIQVENLSKFYNDLCAVDNISLKIEKGEIVGILGPNGAGKTTMLRMLTGYFMPSSGTITIGNLSIEKDMLAIKKTLGYLPESAPLYKEMIVFDYLSLIASIRGIKKSKRLTQIKKIATLCSIDHIMHKTINELSKGLKQRVGIAHAMINDPEILILDEPTSGLDPNQIIEIRKIIRKIGETKTVILSTHILSEAEATCDRIIIINKGKIVADDKTENLKKYSKGKRMINLSLKNAEFKNVDNLLSKIKGVNHVALINKNQQLNIALECSPKKELRQEIYQNIKNTNWILTEFHQKAKNLESIFSELTREV